MDITFKKNLKYIVIAFLAITLNNGLIDYLFGDVIDWGLNMFIALFSIGIFLLFGGLLQKAFIKDE